MAREHAAAREGHEITLTTEATDVLAEKLREGALSARGLNKVTSVAQTIADLAEADVVTHNHVAEALSLRAGRSVVVA